MIIVALLLTAPRLHAQTNPDWTTPIAPFHIAGNLYYVGGATDFAYAKDTYAPATVDRILHDGDAVKEAGRPLDVVIVGSWYVNPGWRLVDRPGQPASYPGIAADYRRMFATLEALPCDIFLGAHGAYFDMAAKLKRANAGAGENVWIDPAGYQAALAEREQAFETELRRQEKIT
jgi:metallo-beta-lactamase class B